MVGACLDQLNGEEGTAAGDADDGIVFAFCLCTALRWPYCRSKKFRFLLKSDIL